MSRSVVKPTALVVDDETRVVESIRLILENRFEVLHAASGEAALEILCRKSVDLMFLDIKMPGGMDGMEVLRRVKDSGEDVVVVMVTATNTAAMAVQAMKLGACDYIAKPFNPDEITVVADRAVENRALAKEIACFRSQIEPVYFRSIVGRSRAMRRIYETISKISETDATVLISGETGTGKELVARAIHFNSPRQKKPCVTINCTGIPDNLLETELFGHEKGSFTGAYVRKLGKFELAHKGTVFLDEVSSLRLDMQGKILRALQEGEIERVGGIRTFRVDFRIIAATNIDLKEAVRKERFRKDLYYRLNVVPIVLPALRNRREDIPLLAESFIRIYNKRFRKNVKGFSEDAMEYLMDYDWPGNVRELENVVERLIVLADRDVLDTACLPFDIFLKSRQKDLPTLMDKHIFLKDAREQFEKEYIAAVLKRSGWNHTESARILGIHRNTLMTKREQLGIRKTGDES